MATLGNQTLGTDWFLQGINVNNACYSNYTMPTGGGLVTAISAYFDVDTGGPVTCYVCVWNSGTGALLASQSIASVPNGSQNASGQAWHTGNLNTGVYIAGGVGIDIGFWVPQANGFVCTCSGSGSSFYQVNAGSSPSGLGAGSSTGHTTIGSYITYTPGGSFWINTGTSGAPVWTVGQVQVNTGTPGAPVWTAGETVVNTGTPASPVWTDTQ